MSNSTVSTTRFLPRLWFQAATTWLWFWLRSPWLATFAGLIGVMLILAVWQLPQLPGQLVDEHAAAATWLLNTSSAYGIWGNAFLALGLFDVLRSPMLYLLLALLVPTLAAQLADQLGALVQLHNLQRYNLATPATAAGERITISPIRPLFRWRGMVQATPAQVASVLSSNMPLGFTISNKADASTLLPENQPKNEAMADTAQPTESRILAARRPYLQHLRPLLMVGLLVAVAGAWIALAFGWQVTAPPLAPGATYRSANRGLVLQYSVALTNTPATTLYASLQGEEVSLSTQEASQLRVGSATLQVRPDYLGLWIATADGSQRLTLPGEAKMRSAIGFVFATPGHEESILIPDQGAGMRIVQRADSDNFVLELYRSDAIQPFYRADLTRSGQLTIPFAPGDTELIITALPGIQVNVSRLPGLWLVPIGFLLALVGAGAFIRSSGFLLVQVAPWVSDTAVVVLQADHPDTIDDLHTVLSTLTSLPTLVGANNASVNNAAGETLPPPASQVTPGKV